MSMKEKAAVLSHQTRPQEASPTTIVHPTKEEVKYDIPVKDMVEVVRNIYPKYDKVIQSKCEHGEDYGIQLRKDAMDALLVKYEQSLAKPSKKEQRTKGYRVQCRLSLERYIQFQRSVRAANTSIQSVLETAVVNFINQNQREDSHDQTAQ